MEIAGPLAGSSAECERILRSLPRWFGIESSLLEYVADADRWPTFHALDAGKSVAFVIVRQHFPFAWEVHCIGVHAERRGQGIGRRLHTHVEGWLQSRGARFLQVKTLADAHPSQEYAQTRAFYGSMGYLPQEVFPTLWGPGLPVLQLVKCLAPPGSAG
jgi:GNAT superfamily N-acetyltransferase